MMQNKFAERNILSKKFLMLYNLSCYSADYLLQNAKKGFEVQYNEHKEKLNLLSNIIGDYEGGDKKDWSVSYPWCPRGA